MWFLNLLESQILLNTLKLQPLLIEFRATVRVVLIHTPNGKKWSPNGFIKCPFLILHLIPLGQRYYTFKFEVLYSLPL